RSVAVKVVRGGRVSPDARDRFESEQRVLARLHQTHIVPIHAAGEEGGVQFFAMAYIDGAPLSRVVQAVYDRETSGPHGRTPTLRELAESAPPGPGPADPTAPTAAYRPPAPARPRDPEVRLRLSAAYFRSVAGVMAEVAEAVQYAHAVQVYHRDLKP